MKISNIIILFIIVVSIILGWGSIHLYANVRETIEKSESEALIYLKENAEVNDVRSVNFYHGSESYSVFEGTNEAKEAIYIWVENSLDNHIVKAKDSGLAFEEVLLYAKEELKPKEIISIKLGIENLIPLYEIIYKDQQDRYSYYYISFKDGTYLKHYHLDM
jgi:uncharacterized protein YpmB